MLRFAYDNATWDALLAVLAIGYVLGFTLGAVLVIGRLAY